MNTFAATAANGRTKGVTEGQADLMTIENTGPHEAATSIPATFLQVTAAGGSEAQVLFRGRCHLR